MSAVKIGLMMASQFLLITFNYRMIAAGSYLGTALSEVGLLLLGWSIIKSVAEAKTVLDRVGYTVGGVVGSLSGLYLTGA